MSTEAGRGGAQAKRRSTASEDLQRLERGEIDLDAYLESRVELALSKLGGRVSEEQRAFLRQLALDQLETDPVLRKYVRQATGREPG